MAKAEPVTIQATQEALEPVILAHITEALAIALGGQQPKLVKAIEAALNAPVDASGNPSSYTSSVPWIRWATREAIYKAVRGALDGALAEQNAQLRKALQKAMAKGLVPVLKAKP